MITRQHLGLALICGLVVASATVGFDPVLVLVILAGTGIGAIVPDIHMKRPKKTRPLTIAWYIVQFGRRVCMPPMCQLYRVIWGIRIQPDDKRLTHSLPGAFLYYTLLAGIAGAECILTGNSIPATILGAFLCGLLMGMIFHLTADLCTRKGIQVFFPFTGTGIHGSIRPCDANDHRIRRFHIQQGSVLVVFLTIQGAEVWPAYCIIPFGLLGAGVCIGSMICQSDIRIEPDAGSGSAAPEATTV